MQSLAPMLTSGIVHLLVLVTLALMYSAADGRPERTPIILGMAPESAAEELAPLEIAAVDPAAAAGTDDAAPEEIAAETPAAWDAILPEPGSLTEPIDLAEALLPDRSVADDAAAVAALHPADILADVPTDVLGGGGGAETGAGRGRAAGGRAAAGHAPGRDAAMFFGREGSGRRVCFMCDNSNSHRDGGFHAVLDEVARSVDALAPEQSFFVIFFSDAAYPLFHPASVDALQPATAENKRRLREWLGTVEMCSGGQGIHEAVRLAGSLAPDVVYLLSDGEFSGSVVDRVRAADLGDAVVHTFGIQQAVVDRRTGQVVPDKVREQQGFNRNLLDIATAHGGRFTPVVPPPLAAALEKMRPIPRNRSRGAVWGLRL